MKDSVSIDRVSPAGGRDKVGHFAPVAVDQKTNRTVEGAVSSENLSEPSTYWSLVRRRKACGA